MSATGLRHVPGKMVEIADRKELFDHPLHPYSRALFEAVPIADPRKRRTRSEGIVGGETASNVNTPSGCPFHPDAHCKGSGMSGESGAEAGGSRKQPPDSLYPV